MDSIHDDDGKFRDTVLELLPPIEGSTVRLIIATVVFTPNEEVDTGALTVASVMWPPGYPKRLVVKALALAIDSITDDES